jgi:uncharacterized protein (TIRG00374 family)
VTFADAFSIRLSGEAVEFLTFSGPFLAEPAKAWLLHRRGLTPSEGFAATLIEYLVYSFIAAGMSIVAMVWLLVGFPMTRRLHAVVIAILVGQGLFLAISFATISTRFYLIGTIIQRVSRLPVVRQRFHPDMNAVNRMEDLLLAVLRDRPHQLISIVMFEFVAHALQLVELYAIMRSFHLAFSLSTVFLIEAASKFMSAAFFFIPGQVGAAEGTYAILFELVGLPAAAGFAVPFVRRIRTLLVSAAGIALFSRFGARRRTDS